MKRFTETLKWRDLWFRRLSGTSKLFWVWICDNCDAAGVVEIDLKITGEEMGLKLNQGHLQEMSEKLVKIGTEKYLAKKFIAFQYGSLSRDCKPHLQVFRCLDSAGLEYPFKGFCEEIPKGLETLKDKEEDKDKETEKDSGKGGVGGNRPTVAQAEAVYEIYPRKVARPEALKAILKALGKIPFDDLMARTTQYAASPGKDPDFIPHPSTWFNQERYNDDPTTWVKTGPRNGCVRDGTLEITGQRVHGKIVVIPGEQA